MQDSPPSWQRRSPEPASGQPHSSEVKADVDLRIAGGPVEAAAESRLIGGLLQRVLAFDKARGFENEPSLHNLIFTSLGAAGEAGEVANVVKKMWRDGAIEENREALAGEVCDVLIYLAKLILIARLDIDGALAAKLGKLEQRWPQKGPRPEPGPGAPEGSPQDSDPGAGHAGR